VVAPHALQRAANGLVVALVDQVAAFGWWAEAVKEDPSSEQALDELHKFSGIQFDPEVVVAFDRLVAQKPEWLKPNIPKHLVEKYIPKLGEAEATASPA